MNWSSSSLVLATASNRIVTIGTQIVLGFLLVPAQLGEFALALAICNLSNFFQSADLSRVSLQNQSELSRDTATIRNLQMLGCLLTWAGLWVFSAAFPPSVRPWFVLLLGGLPLLRVFNNGQVVLLSAAGRSVDVALATVAEGVTRGLVVVGGALAGYGAAALVWGEVSAMLASTALLTRAQRPTFSANLVPSLALRAKLWKTGLSNILMLVDRELPVFVVGALCSVAAAGSYAFGNRIAMQLSIIMVPMMVVETLPRLMTARRESMARYREIRRQERQRLLKWGLPAAVLLGAAAPLLMLLVWGDRWRLAALLTPFIVTSIAIRIGYGVLRAELEAAGRFDALLKLSAIDAVLILVSLPTSAALGDVQGVVAATLLQAILMSGLAYRVVSRERIPGAAS